MSKGWVVRITRRKDGELVRYWWHGGAENGDGRIAVFPSEAEAWRKAKSFFDPKTIAVKEIDTTAIVTVLELPEITQRMGDLFAAKDEHGMELYLKELGTRAVNPDNVHSLAVSVLATMPTAIRDWWRDRL